MSNVVVSSSDGRNSGDALRALGRVADAFDDPSLRKTDKELKFVVNVVESHHLSTNLSSQESMYQYQDATHKSRESSFDFSYDEDVQLLVLRDVSVWEHTGSSPYTSRRYQSTEPRYSLGRIVCKGNGMYDVSGMLLTSSPLDRLDRLARLELKKTGWFERTDKWTVVEMGLQGLPLPTIPSRTPSRNTDSHSESFTSTKTRSPNGGKQAPCSPRRPKNDGGQSPSKRKYGCDTPKRSQHRDVAIKYASIQSPADSRESDSYLVELSYTDSPHTNSRTSVRAPRLSRTLTHSRICQEQARGRLGRVVRNFVKRMIPPTSGSGSFANGTSYPQTRHVGNIKGACLDSPSCQVEMTPRSDRSGESGWTFAESASSWAEAGAQGYLDHQATNRWSGFWH